MKYAKASAAGIEALTQKRPTCRHGLGDATSQKMRPAYLTSTTDIRGSLSAIIVTIIAEIGREYFGMVCSPHESAANNLMSKPRWSALDNALHRGANSHAVEFSSASS